MASKKRFEELPEGELKALRENDKKNGFDLCKREHHEINEFFRIRNLDNKTRRINGMQLASEIKFKRE